MIPIPQPSVISRQQLPASLHVDASRAFRLSKLLLRRLNGFPRFLKPCRTQDSDADVRRRAYYQQLLLEFMPGLLLRRYNGFPRFLKPCRTLDSDASRCTFRSDSDASEQRNSISYQPPAIIISLQPDSYEPSDHCPQPSAIIHLMMRPRLEVSQCRVAVSISNLERHI